MSKFTGYSLESYGVMMLDGVRLPAYVEALRQHVKSGMVVADLGAATGVLSLLACKLGAARVYAIDPDISIEVARESALANGYGDRITCIAKLSTEVKLPEKVDLIVSDMRGSLPLLDFHLPTIKDARERFLKPDGRLIPAKDVMRCAPVDFAAAYERLESPWMRNELDLNLNAARKYVVKEWWRYRIESEHLLSEPQDWATLDYQTVSQPNVDGTMEWTIRRAGTLHGLCMWFDTTLCEGVGYSTGPGCKDTVYGHSFIPLDQPVDVVEGDRLEAHIRADMVQGGYVKRWNCTVTSADGMLRARFSQNDVGSAPIQREQLDKRRDDFVPSLGEKGEIARFVLEKMAQSETLKKIAEEVVEQFPKRFANWRKALETVTELSIRYAA